jgi:hypothetical protein
MTMARETPSIEDMWQIAAGVEYVDWQDNLTMYLFRKPKNDNEPFSEISFFRRSFDDGTSEKVSVYRNFPRGSRHDTRFDYERFATPEELAVFAFIAKRDLPESLVTTELVDFANKKMLEHQVRLDQCKQLLGKLGIATSSSDQE